MADLLKSGLIKRPNEKVLYTPEQLEEFRRCIDPETGLIYFLSHYFYVQNVKKGKMLFNPYPYQIRMLDAYIHYRRVVGLTPRQAGKTISAAGFLLWSAMFTSDLTILIAAHKFKAAQEIMRRIKFGYENIPNYIRAGVTEYNKQSLEFDNGSRIEAHTTTENTGRSMSIGILYCDELAFVRPTIAREFWASISLTLSTGGKVIVTSTPNNPDDLFSDLWHGANQTEDENGNTINNELGVNGFKAVSARWDEHPDRDDDWLEEQKRIINDPGKVAREILCKFITYEETLVNPFALNQIKGIEPTRNEGQIRWYKEPRKNMSYLVGLDPSLGTGGDPSAIQIVELGTNQQIAEWVDNKTPIEKQVELLKDITTELVKVTENPERVWFSVENNSLGEAVLVAIRNFGEENIPGIFLSEPQRMGNVHQYRKGFNTTHATKLVACAKLKSMIEGDKLKIFSKKLISELRTFISVENTYRAKIGENDDLVTSMLLIMRMMDTLKNYVPELGDDYEPKEENIPLPFIVSIDTRPLW
ncbi:Terminase-like family protein [uncultured archaeon]|nr:Terminase-like family protein [uncultured archaeon]